MYICPVCGSHHGAACCTVCGFDESRNYEHYPTFAVLPEPIDAISQRVAAQATYLRCETCGGIRFLADTQTAQLICTTCRHVIDIGKVFPSQGYLAAQQELPKKRQKLPPVQQDDTQQDDAEFRRMRQAHEHWSIPVTAGSRIDTDNTQHQNAAPDWRRSEAAHRQWLKSLEKQGASTPREPAADWRRSEAAHRQWLKALGEQLD